MPKETHDSPETRRHSPKTLRAGISIDTGRRHTIEVYLSSGQVEIGAIELDVRRLCQIEVDAIELEVCPRR